MEFKEFNCGKHIYYCNKDGVILSENFHRIKPHIDEYGYLAVTLSKGKDEEGKYKRNSYRVHSIVAKLFLPKPVSNIALEVNHKDYDRLNPSVENLEWVTHLENVRYSVKGGHYQNSDFTGEGNPKSKLKEKDVIKIRKELQYEYNYREIAEMYNVCTSTIAGIINYKTWKNVHI